MGSNFRCKTELIEVEDKIQYLEDKRSLFKTCKCCVRFIDEFYGRIIAHAGALRKPTINLMSIGCGDMGHELNISEALKRIGMDVTWTLIDPCYISQSKLQAFRELTGQRENPQKLAYIDFATYLINYNLFQQGEMHNLRGKHPRHVGFFMEYLKKLTLGLTRPDIIILIDIDGPLLNAGSAYWINELTNLVPGLREPEDRLFMLGHQGMRVKIPGQDEIDGRNMQMLKSRVPLETLQLEPHSPLRSPQEILREQKIHFKGKLEHQLDQWAAECNKNIAINPEIIDKLVLELKVQFSREIDLSDNITADLCNRLKHFALFEAEKYFTPSNPVLRMLADILMVIFFPIGIAVGVTRLYRGLPLFFSTQPICPTFDNLCTEEYFGEECLYQASSISA